MSFNLAKFFATPGAVIDLDVIYAIFMCFGQWSVFNALSLVLVLLGFAFYLFVYIYNRRKRRCDPRLPLSDSGEDQQSEDVSENSP